MHIVKFNVYIRISELDDVIIEENKSLIIAATKYDPTQATPFACIHSFFRGQVIDHKFNRRRVDFTQPSGRSGHRDVAGQQRVLLGWGRCRVGGSGCRLGCSGAHCPGERRCHFGGSGGNCGSGGWGRGGSARCSVRGCGFLLDIYKVDVCGV